MNNIRIAFCGNLRSGKSTCAEHLVSNHGFVSLSFASKMKTVAKDLFQFSEVYKTKYKEIKCPFSEGGVERVPVGKPRKLFQDFGEAVRALDERIWIQHTESSMKIWEGFRNVRGIVIDDLRLPVEYDWCRDKGFVIVKVVASDGEREARAVRAGDDFSPKDMAHETESHVDGFDADYTINNDGDKDALRRQVDDVMAEIIPV